MPPGSPRRLPNEEPIDELLYGLVGVDGGRVPVRSLGMDAG